MTAALNDILHEQLTADLPCIYYIVKTQTVRVERHIL
jgi:hypothetical protein